MLAWREQWRLMLARSLFLGLTLTLAACGGPDPRAPITQTRVPPGLAAACWPPPGWTWGLIQVGDQPPQRYGVAAPDATPRAQVLILPDYGESAEDLYPLAGALIADGVVVWTLDGAGQGGSGHLVSPRDLGHVRSFAPDIAAIGQLITQAIRPRPQAPLILVADGDAALIALARLQAGAPVAGLVLIHPTAAAPGGARAAGPIGQVATGIGLSAMRAPGGQGWSADGPQVGAGRAWRLANPALRMGGPSLGWLRAYAQLQASVERTGLGRLAPPVLILTANTAPDADRRLADHLCAALPACAQAALTSQDQQIEAFVRTVSAAKPLARPFDRSPQG